MSLQPITTEALVELLGTADAAAVAVWLRTTGAALVAEGRSRALGPHYARAAQVLAIELTIAIVGVRDDRADLDREAAAQDDYDYDDEEDDDEEEDDEEE
jgi:hypothetical protein